MSANLLMRRAESGELIDGVKRITMDFDVEFGLPKLNIEINSFDSEFENMILLSEKEFNQLTKKG